MPVWAWQRILDVPTLAAMFTGIVEKTVRVIGVADGPKFVRITLPTSWDDVRDGESVAVNGVCLTVAERSPGELGFDVVQETLDKTNLKLVQAGDEVHLERRSRRRPDRRPFRPGTRGRHRPAARTGVRREGMAAAAARRLRRWRNTWSQRVPCASTA